MNNLVWTADRQVFCPDVQVATGPGLTTEALRGHRFIHAVFRDGTCIGWAVMCAMCMVRSVVGNGVLCEGCAK